MIKEVLVNAQHILMEDGRGMRLSYYLTSQRSMDDNEAYGIKVIKEGENLESEWTGPISKSKDWVKEVCNKIAGCKVTPMGLINVVDDMIT